MEKLDRATHVLQEDAEKGTVQIADEVVAIIAGMAATEVKGVASMAGNIKNELVAKMGMKSLSKGVKVEVTDTDGKGGSDTDSEIRGRIFWQCPVQFRKK